MKMRRGWLRLVFAATLTIGILLYASYYTSPQKGPRRSASVKKELSSWKGKGRPARRGNEVDLQIRGKGQGVPTDQCPALESAKTDINTVEQLPKFEFQVRFEGLRRDGG